MSCILPHLPPADSLRNTVISCPGISRRGSWGHKHHDPIRMLVPDCHAFQIEPVGICRLAFRCRSPYLGDWGLKGAGGNTQGLISLPSPAPGELTGAGGPLCLCLHYGTSSDVHFPPCQNDIAQSTLRPWGCSADEIIGTKFVFADSPQLGSRAPGRLGR